MGPVMICIGCLRGDVRPGVIGNRCLRGGVESGVGRKSQVTNFVVGNFTAISNIFLHTLIVLISIRELEIFVFAINDNMDKI